MNTTSFSHNKNAAKFAKWVFNIKITMMMSIRGVDVLDSVSFLEAVAGWRLGIYGVDFTISLRASEAGRS